MPVNSDQDDDQTDDQSDDSADNSTDAAAPATPEDAVQKASPDEADAHKGLLGEALGMLSDQGIDLDALAQKYGLPHVDVDNLSAGQLAQLTMKLAQEHPEIVQEAASRFPEAQGLLSQLTGGGGAGGMLGGLMGRFLG